eukprot:3050663-Rhodomonas_salina.2
MDARQHRPMHAQPHTARGTKATQPRSACPHTIPAPDAHDLTARHRHSHSSQLLDHRSQPAAPRCAFRCSSRARVPRA